MEVIFQKSFIKQFKKLSPKVKEQFFERLQLLQDNHEDSKLKVHTLQGKYLGLWSMNVTGDVRALFCFEGNEIIIFVLIGTHSELYG